MPARIREGTLVLLFREVHSRGAVPDTSLINSARIIAEIAVLRVHCFKLRFSAFLQKAYFRTKHWRQGQGL